MTKDEALKMAIEYIEKSQYEKRDEVINACKEALEQPNPEFDVVHYEQPAQEPVAWYWDNFRDGKPHADVKRGSPKLDGIFGTPIPLYTKEQL